MRKIERIKKNISENKSIMTRLKANKYYSLDDLIKDIRCYIAALKAGRLQYSVLSISRSGMCRNITIQSCERSTWDHKTRYYYRQYNNLLEILGYSIVRGYTDVIRVGGCGMDMLFATNYSLIHTFARMGFISKKECSVLCQKIN